MPTVQLAKVKEPKHDNAVRAKIFTFIQKLGADDTNPSLHVEPMQQAADPRARTGRVDQFWRAVLYRIDTPTSGTTYVYAGTWPHDEAIERARTRALRTNPINGVVEFYRAIADSPPILSAPASPAHQPGQAQPAGESYLGTHGYLRSELVSLIGLDESVADELYAAASEEQLLEISDRLENEWERLAVLGLAVGDTIEKIRSDLGLDHADEVPDDATDDERITKAFEHPATKMQFTFIDTDEELRRVIEGEDFGAWRVFLHPEQREYATKDRNGAFRLTGGAGTGKTVVLLHRTRYLHRADATKCILLTTFNRTLADALSRDLERLDGSIVRADGLGESGVLVRGLDQISAAVRDKTGAAFWSAAKEVFGSPIEPRGHVMDDTKDWQTAIDAVGDDLPKTLQSTSFFEGEYEQVVLPQLISTREQYFSARRPGRGVALDRRKRAAVWSVIEAYRQSTSLAGKITFAEMAAVAAVTLRSGAMGGAPVDHVLIDEGQDLNPLHWMLARALVEEGPDDLFIAEDSHQRIYGQGVVLSRYGIAIRGRSRRLTLNYRTTQQNLGFAMGVLDGASYQNVEEGEEGIVGYRSSRRGPGPVVFGAASVSGQHDAVATAINAWLEQGVPPASIAILARTNGRRDAIKSALDERGVSVSSVKSGEGTGSSPVVMTMHNAKGQEFRCVVLFDMSAGQVPNPVALEHAAPEDRPDVLLRERSLLYVAASRARDQLLVTWSGEPSELLNVVDTLSDPVPKAASGESVES
jgi:superfamily I DNA/RNA helicase